MRILLDTNILLRYAVSGRPAHDTRLVALMLAHGVTHLLTLNATDFARYNEITCLTPENVPEPPPPPEDAQEPGPPPEAQS